jgi:hypothetical protein
MTGLILEDGGIKYIFDNIKNYIMRRYFSNLTFFILGIIAVTVLGLTKNSESCVTSSETLDTVYIYIEDTSMDLKAFLDDLSYIESRGNYSISRGEYWGRYQLSSICRQDINCTIDKQTFLSDSTIQDEVMVTWLLRLKQILDDEIQEYDNTWVGNYYVTESGLLAMAHLVGPENVKKFLINKGQWIPRDGNRKAGTDYLQQYGKYNLQL